MNDISQLNKKFSSHMLQSYDILIYGMFATINGRRDLRHFCTLLLGSMRF